MMSDIRLLTSRSFNQLAQDTAPGPICVEVCAEADDFFSYRRTTLAKEPDYGRQISVIGLV